ncbi:Rhodanese domain-containing protein [Mycena sanguinolenta]|uniref:Rhodanese domain-containing protein n=1 Tax=Mycena sanguinolenta TaxID=230812 RepID=A0A8H6XY53_9AGAR|nr:Rhodanese domain-containing protein [Mycena sanguinolenta]
MKYISGDELAQMMKSDKIANQDYLVVDVRDDDFAGGNIKNAVNLPSRQFNMGVYNLVQKSVDVKVMVFHCALSQMRGPKAARIYEETRNNLNLGQDKPQEVYVLTHGFTQFQQKFKDDPELVVDWDKEVWENAEDWS